MAIAPADIKRCLLQMVKQRGLDKSICPSEVARALGGEEWRSLMPVVREVGVELASSGLIVVLQRGQIVDICLARGPIRFRITEAGMQHLQE